MQIGIFETSEEASAAAAHGVVNFLARKPNATLGVATGPTPEDLYSELREAHAAGRFILEDSVASALDKYVGTADGHPEKYRNVLRREPVRSEKTGLTEVGLRTPVSSDVDSHPAAGQYEASIAAVSGVGLQILGIGANGHIGFNELGGSLVSRTRVEALSRRTRTDNACFFDGDVGKVSSRCVTQGLGTIMEARSSFLPAFGAWKAGVVRRLIEGAISAKRPATVARMHPNLTAFADAEAVELPEYADLYREHWSLA